MLDKLMNNKIRPSQDPQEYLWRGEINREVEDAGETISDSMWKNVLVKGLICEYENTKLTGYRQSDFMLGKNRTPPKSTA